MTTAKTQQLEALAVANEVRLRRASLRRQCRNMTPRFGTGFIADMLTDSEPAIQTLVVCELLVWPKRAQRKVAQRRLAGLGVRNEMLRVRDLSARQRVVLIRELRELAGDGSATWADQVTGRAA